MFDNAKTMRKENKKLAKEKAKNLRVRSKTFLKGVLGQCKERCNRRQFLL